MGMAQPIERQNIKQEEVFLKACCYCRFSSNKQNARSAIEQEEHIRYLVSKGEISSRKHLSNNIQIDPQWVIRDEAVSGRSADRTGYQIILDAMSGKTKPFDILLLDDISRANRDLGNMLDLYGLAKSRGIEIISVSDNLSSEDPNSRIYFTVRGMVADFGNECHALRTLRGMESKILRGLSCGDVVYGYKSTPTRFEKEGAREVARDFKIVIDEEKAHVVRRIYKLFAEGHGRSAICKILNEEKIPWPGFYGNIKMGKGWSTTTLYKILQNPKYIGQWTWKKHAYVLDPISGRKFRQLRPEREWVHHSDNNQDSKKELRIISPTMWNRVQAVFNKLHEDNDHGIWGRFFPDVAKYMLSGMLKCAECGGNMVLITGRRGGYYGCLQSNRNGTCKNKRLIKRTKLEKAIVGHIVGLLKDEANFELAAKKYNELMRTRLSSGDTDIAEYEKELAVIEVELKNLANAIMAGGQSSTVLEAIDSKEKRRRWLQYQIKQTRSLQQEKVYVTPLAMKEKFKRLTDALNKHPNEACNALKKVFPNGLKMIWSGDKWEISGVMVINSKGNATEMKLEV